MRRLPRLRTLAEVAWLAGVPFVAFWAGVGAVAMIAATVAAYLLVVALEAVLGRRERLEPEEPASPEPR